MSLINENEGRGKWGSKFGFIMAAAGSAVGLGNIWRFPYTVGENGGGAFVLIYLICVILIGTPLLFSEMGLGRMTQKNPIGAFRKSGANPFFTLLGGVASLLLSFFILSYYSVIAGWTIGYMMKFTVGGSVDSDAFKEFTGTPGYTIPLMAVFIFLTIWIVRKGVSGGIEKASKILMPIMFFLVLVVAVRGLFLDGAMEGVRFYLTPDFSKITPTTVLSALGQAFFSMAIGWGIMITYGSYLPRKSNIVSSSVWVGLMDAGVALIAGFMIFPAVFAFGQSPEQGPTLVFQVLPAIFSTMIGGAWIGALFFLLLVVAALTSAVAILEVPASYFMDEKKWSRSKSAIVVGVLLFIVGIPSALSTVDGHFFSELSISVAGKEIKGVIDILDYIFGTVLIVVVALVTCIYVAWILPIQKIVSEIDEGSSVFTKYPWVKSGFIFFIRYVCPIVIALVLLSMVGVLEFVGGG